MLIRYIICCISRERERGGEVWRRRGTDWDRKKNHWFFSVDWFNAIYRKSSRKAYVCLRVSHHFSSIQFWDHDPGSPESVYQLPNHGPSSSTGWKTVTCYHVVGKIFAAPGLSIEGTMDTLRSKRLSPNHQTTECGQNRVSLGLNKWEIIFQNRFGSFTHSVGICCHTVSNSK